MIFQIKNAGFLLPLYLKGKTQAWPDLVEHVFGILCSKEKNASSLTASLPGAHKLFKQK